MCNSCCFTYCIYVTRVQYASNIYQVSVICTWYTVLAIYSGVLTPILRKSISVTTLFMICIRTYYSVYYNRSTKYIIPGIYNVLRIYIYIYQEQYNTAHHRSAFLLMTWILFLSRSRLIVYISKVVVTRRINADPGLCWVFIMAKCSMVKLYSRKTTRGNKQYVHTYILRT